MDHEESNANANSHAHHQSPSQSPTFGKDGSFHVDEAVGAASISPSGRDVVLASREGLHIIDLDNPYSPPRHLPHRTPWEVADVQWSPFASRDYWVVSTSNQKALVWNLEMSTTQAPIQYVLHAHSRAITDINFSAHDPFKLATCAVDSFVHCWDFRHPNRPVMSFADWYAGATQVKWNRQDPHIIASSHDRYLHIWDERKGTAPLKTINAHATKIYGIDWSRTEATHILTCSLDKTIKLWDYSRSDEVPTKLIKTSYPVWRARHTPFGWGILAMPQRGNHELHLYDTRIDPDGPEDQRAIVQPVHSFHGHRDQVKEFLWRTQGTVEDGIDNRNFQLVSWSTDRNLLLHRLEDDVLETVGYKTGEKANKNLTFTRKGATYKSFHDEDARKPGKVTGHGLSNLFRNEAQAGMRKAPIPLLGLDGRSLQPTPGSGMRVRSGPTNKDANPITWMKGVKIGDSVTGRNSTQRLTSTLPPWERPENLGDEITFAGEKYKKVSFEKVDVSARFVAVSLSGPWGVEDGLVYLKALIRFPRSYPELSPPEVKVERTSSISDAAFTRITVELKVLCDQYMSIGRGSLEPILRYLLGDSKLEESMRWVAEIQRAMTASVEREVSDSSSDEEGGGIGNFNGISTHDLEASGADVIGTANANANVPLAKACGALWADDGRLICFFAKKDDDRLATARINSIDGDKRPRSAEMFESFGRLKSVAFKTNKMPPSLDPTADEGSSDFSDSSSFSSSSAETDSDYTGRRLAAVWSKHGPNFRAPRGPFAPSIDQQSSARTLPQRRTGSTKQVISLHSFDELLPSKRILAEQYEIYGAGPKVCNHNAQVAMNNGLPDLADIWILLSLILCDDVPLELLMRPQKERDVFVLARRALVHIKRRDSGLDLAFDEPDAVVNSKLNGRVKWGQHPLAGSWIVEMIFEHYETLADVQMLAMISCVLDEGKKGRNALSDSESTQETSSTPASDTAAFFKEQASTSLTPKPPAISLEYFSSADTALSLLQPKSPGSAPGRLVPVAPTFGSYASSTGAWSSDGNETDRMGHNSDQSSPLLMTRQNSRTSNSGQALSSSPEQHFRRSNSAVSNVFGASFSKQFASFLTSASSSPPNLSRTPELSTSAPTSGPSPSGITWGRNTVYRDNTSMRRVDSRTSTLYDLDDSSVMEEEVAVTEEEDTVIRLKHQNMFDDEACLDIPLLNPENEPRYRAYREAYAKLLYTWGLPLVRCEVLKFNAYDYDDPTTRPDPNSNRVSSSDENTAVEFAPRDGLGIAITCAMCGGDIVHTGDGPLCERCQMVQTRVPCSICAEAVEGLYEPCLLCGHVAHLDCVAMLLQDEAGLVDECEAGCGCLCADGGESGLGMTDSLGVDDLQTRVREELGISEWSGR